MAVRKNPNGRSPKLPGLQLLAGGKDAASLTADSNPDRIIDAVPPDEEVAPPVRALRWEVDPAFPWYDQSARATQKAQAQWLHSRNLLTPAERCTLPAEWFAPAKPKLEVIG